MRTDRSQGEYDLISKTIHDFTRSCAICSFYNEMTFDWVMRTSSLGL